MTTTPFHNEPFLDFQLPANKSAMEAALAKVKSQFGKTYPLLINGKAVTTESVLPSTNPARISEVIGSVCQATRQHIEEALEVATRRFEDWRYTSAELRATYLFKAAAVIRRDKLEWAAWQVYEAGKNWAEADGDVAEAIDFLEYYGREMLRYGEGTPLVPLPGEYNRQLYIPLGVGVIIPPWNFPLAIMVGMTTSAIVTGNTVLLKPSPNTSVIAARFVQMMHDIGLPDGVINFVPGPPEEIGDFMVDHPKTRFVSFTGSKAVGLRISERAAKTASGQRWMKRVIAEMGGKDGIVVDEHADLELAATDIVSSAFGFQGQKCSAASRAILHKKVYDEIVERVVEKTKALKMGPPEQNFYNGPVIEQKSVDKIMRYIEIGKSEANLLVGGERGPSEGYYIQPTVFADAKRGQKIMCEEIFGPVLAMYRADNFEDALDTFNDTEYGLTGSVYSYNRAHLEQARDRMHCGNLYFNRKCTGALVGVHPFGGFHMSGTDSKAGGPDYLLQFMQAKVVSERF
ncbi:MAG: L-glutamate gamma-semialdehyde dehydrogenase [Alicyclobacillaceae bacterium]|uniref:L-glutamate gamma-semialdehyde dehydrogenase n=1 Tax=Alicyclobacillus sp. SP_1 TaxID=2942475 RepID=UPI0021580651|nr:L-glutamate gamma-semialdehyde dehydrogenase [Alicyclobacillus sp. SP_1]MCY0889226.1 L-glutamate gamma-semialdehyde dehydrogenase [Alicyclobacillaceae bacterium]